MMHAIWLSVLFAGVIFADDPDDPVKKDKEKLQGTWVATETMSAGKKHDIETRFEFDGDKITMAVKGEPTEKSKYSIDPGKSPANLDIVIERRGKKITIPAVYELKGDKLTICHPFTQSGDRPKKLEATAKTVFVTFKREKPKEDK